MSIQAIKIGFISVSIVGLVAFGFIKFNKASPLPLVAIASYGPHSSLEACTKGIKEELKKQGFIENQNVRYEMAHVGFDSSLIPQMITQLKNKHPKAMVVMTTPIAQFAKGSVKNIPLVYSVITDPIEAGLSPMIGSSDKQDMNLLLGFAKQLIPQAKKVGLLYATAEANDRALVNMMKQAALKAGLELVAVPVDSAREVPLRMEYFNQAEHKVDFIYVGTSGPIQPTLPVIASKAKKMGIPVFNVDSEAVKSGLVLASFGVNYEQVGANTAKLVAQLLKGVDQKQLQSSDPTKEDHQGYINKTQAEVLGITLPQGGDYVEIK